MIVIKNHLGNDVEVFADAIANGIYARIRSDSEAERIYAFEARGLLQRDENNELVYAPGVTYFAYPPIELTPATYDEDGNEITPAIHDTRPHGDIFVGEPALSVMDDNFENMSKVHVTLLMWSGYGDPNIVPNANEQGRKLSGITLIDSRTISTPRYGLG